MGIKQEIFSKTCSDLSLSHSIFGDASVPFLWILVGNMEAL